MGNDNSTLNGTFALSKEISIFQAIYQNWLEIDFLILYY